MAQSMGADLCSECQQVQQRAAKLGLQLRQIPEVQPAGALPTVAATIVCADARAASSSCSRQSHGDCLHQQDVLAGAVLQGGNAGHCSSCMSPDLRINEAAVQACGNV